MELYGGTRSRVFGSDEEGVMICPWVLWTSVERDLEAGFIASHFGGDGVCSESKLGEGLGEKLLDRIRAKYPRTSLIATTTESQHSRCLWLRETHFQMEFTSQLDWLQVLAADDPPTGLMV